MATISHDRPAQTRVEIDPDLHAVAEWMQANIPASRLVAVAGGLAAIAPMLWARFQSENIQAIQLVGKPIVEPHTPVAASE
jgi:hypothetical protein